MNMREAVDNSRNRRIMFGEVLLMPHRRRTPDGGEIEIATPFQYAHCCYSLKCIEPNNATLQRGAGCSDCVGDIHLRVLKRRCTDFHALSQGFALRSSFLAIRRWLELHRYTHQSSAVLQLKSFLSADLRSPHAGAN